MPAFTQQDRSLLFARARSAWKELKTVRANLVISRAELPEFQPWLVLQYTRRRLEAKHSKLPQEFIALYNPILKRLIERTRALPGYANYKQAKAEYEEVMLLYEFSWEEDEGSGVEA